MFNSCGDLSLNFYHDFNVKMQLFPLFKSDDVQIMKITFEAYLVPIKVYRIWNPGRIVLCIK